MSGSAAARLSGALLIAGLTAPSSLLLAGAASAADPLVSVEALEHVCGVRLTTESPSQHLVSLALSAREPVRPLRLEQSGDHELNSSSPLDLEAEPLRDTTPEQVYRATVTVDGAEEPPVDLKMPECAGEAGGSPQGGAASASPSPSGSPSPSAAGSPAVGASPSPASASPASASPSSASPSSAAAQAPAMESTASAATPAEPVHGSSGVVALSGAISALVAPVEAGPAMAPAAAPPPVVAPAAGTTVVTAALPAPLAAALPAADPAPVPGVATEPVAAPTVSAAADAGPLENSLPALTLAAGSVAGVLGVRLRRRAQAGC